MIPRRPTARSLTARTRPVVRLLALGATLGGCSAHEIWLLQVDGVRASSCEDVVTHNFENATPLEEVAGTWVYGSDSESSPELVFAEITTTSRNSAVMVIGDQAWPGTWEDGGWIFEWTEGDATADWQDHSSGYGYAAYVEHEEEWTISFKPDGDTAAGAMRSIIRDTQTWKETDGWSDAAADDVGWTGQIPSEQYLIRTGDEGSEPAVNDGEVADCASDICEVALTTTCTYNRDIAATRTDLKEEDAYGHLAEAGN